MEDQVRHLAIGRPPRPRGLPQRGLETQVDLAEEDGAVGIEQIGRIGEGEREHVGGAVDLAVVAVQPSDQSIVAEDDGRARPRPAQEPERAPDEGLKSCRS